MKRAILTALLFAGLACAQTLDDGAPVAAGSHTVTVYVTKKGKIYHSHRDCVGLSRSDVFKASEHDAQVHGLTLCKICAHRHHAQTKDNGSWAAREAK